MNALAFLASTAGRVLRSAVGVVLIIVAAILGGWWWLLAIPGAVLVLVGVFDVCLIAPLVGKPLRGKDLRAALSR